MIRDVFVRHIADEEALIVPILEVDLPVGPIRVEALHEKHDRQRGGLETLCAWPEEGGDASSPRGSRPLPGHCSRTSTTRSASS